MKLELHRIAAGYQPKPAWPRRVDNCPQPNHKSQTPQQHGKISSINHPFTWYNTVQKINPAKLRAKIKTLYQASRGHSTSPPTPPPNAAICKLADFVTPPVIALVYQCSTQFITRSKNGTALVCTLTPYTIIRKDFETRSNVCAGYTSVHASLLQTRPEGLVMDRVTYGRHITSNMSLEPSAVMAVSSAPEVNTNISDWVNPVN
ncbi:hypothetical protein IRJ41_006018 [Triplophysa rosa]|uniref:Uncharacterized protein n=1 Tax=Triplophysa rosa TaxID=992332 RepID=A0A9W7WSL4_TRIRA|nr:hypothetical protein IRJ41_006018 [Triplophysa rosa]